MAGLLSYQLTPQANTGQFLGNALTGLGAGLLAYGSGGQGRQNAGIIGLQALQQAQQDRQEQQYRALQTQSMTQQLAQQQQQMQIQQQAMQQAGQQREAYKGLLGGQPIQGPTQSGAPLDMKSPVNPALSGLPAGVQAALPIMDPQQGTSLIAQAAMAKPQAPTTVGGMQYDPAQKKFVPIPGYAEQASAIAAAGRAPQQAPSDVQEYQFAKSQGYTGSFMDYTKTKASNGQSKYGMQPVWGTDQNGKPVLMAMGNNGTVIQPMLPNGVTPTPGVSLANTGTGTQPLSNKSGLPIAPLIPKDVQGAAAQAAAGTQQGTVQGQVQATLPDTLTAADQTHQMIQDLKNDPTMDEATGLKGKFMNIIPGTKAYGYTQKVTQLKARSFMGAIQQMRGMGALSDAEGAKAGIAMGRLDQAQSKEDFSKALDDLDTIIEQGKQNLLKKAAGGGQLAPVADPLGIR